MKIGISEDIIEDYEIMQIIEDYGLDFYPDNLK